MFAVPFENLDIGLGRSILCEESRFLNKIVKHRRGGFCYELNGAFAALLRALGFPVTLLSARVARIDGSEGPEFDHMTLLVDAQGLWLADVGFGESFLEPLRLEPDLDQEQAGRLYRITLRNGRYHYSAYSDRTWKDQYSFDLRPRRLSDFAAMCHYHQTSPESHFTQKRICSLATPEGRITISGNVWIETRMGKREERVISEEEARALLQQRFGVRLDA